MAMVSLVCVVIAVDIALASLTAAERANITKVTAFFDCDFVATHCRTVSQRRACVLGCNYLSSFSVVIVDVKGKFYSWWR